MIRSNVIATCLLAWWTTASTEPRVPPLTRPVRAGSRCADFLLQMNKKPAKVIYLGCRYAPNQQGKPLLATYSVQGQFASIVETRLGSTIGLVKLRRSCCQWDSPAHTFKDKEGREFQVTMTSPETTIGSRTAWGKIPKFGILIKTYTEEI